MATNRLSIPVHNALAFTWAGTVGVADVSDLPEHFYSRVYKDACDIGFYVRSERTGRFLLFTETARMEASEGELAGWVFTSDDGFTIKVFND